MSLEDLFVSALSADTSLVALLPGGIYPRGSLGEEGITRQETPSAFDTNGYLLPTGVVAQRAENADGQVVDPIQGIYSAIRVVEIYVLQDRTYVAIDLAVARIVTILQGSMVGGGAELYLSSKNDRLRDDGALNGASMARLEWPVHLVEGL